MITAGTPISSKLEQNVITYISSTQLHTSK
jgi:hypothetical protein